MLSGVPDPTLQSLISLRKSYLEKFNSGEAKYLPENAAAFTKLSSLIVQDAAAEDFNKIVSKLTAIEAAASIVQSALAPLKDIINEYKKSVETGEAESVQEKKLNDMIAYADAYDEKCNSFKATLPFPKFIPLKTKLQAFSLELTNNKPSETVDDFSRFHENEVKINNHLLEANNNRTAFAERYKDTLRGLQLDTDATMLRYNTLLLASAKRKAEKLIAIRQEITDQIRAESTAKISQQFAALGTPTVRSHHRVPSEIKTHDSPPPMEIGRHSPPSPGSDDELKSHTPPSPPGTVRTATSSPSSSPDRTPPRSPEKFEEIKSHVVEKSAIPTYSASTHARFNGAEVAKRRMPEAQRQGDKLPPVDGATAMRLGKQKNKCVIC
jgi:hypothetical protein